MRAVRGVRGGKRAHRVEFRNYERVGVMDGRKKGKEEGQARSACTRYTTPTDSVRGLFF